MLGRMVGGCPEGEPDVSVFGDPLHGLSVGGSCDTEGEGEPDGKRARRCEGFQIFVNMGKSFVLFVESSDTVLCVKNVLHAMEGLPPDQQRLTFGDKPLANAQTLGDYNISAGCQLHLTMGLRGGMDGGEGFDTREM